MIATTETSSSITTGKRKKKPRGRQNGEPTTRDTGKPNRIVLADRAATEAARAGARAPARLVRPTYYVANTAGRSSRTAAAAAAVSRIGVRRPPVAGIGRRTGSDRGGGG